MTLKNQDAFQMLNAVHILERLGLTSNQALAYLSLIRLGCTNAKTIARHSGITRSDVYRIMPQLQKIGLAEKVLTTPLKFQATPVEPGFKLLIEHKNREALALQKAAQETCQMLKKRESQLKAPLIEAEPEFIIFPKHRRGIEKRRTLICSALANIDMINSISRLRRLVPVYLEAANEAMERGVKFRLITEKIKSADLPRELEALEKKPSFQIKYLLDFPSILMSIYDNEQVLIVTESDAGLGECPLLWSNNSVLKSMAVGYFEFLWDTSQRTR